MCNDHTKLDFFNKIVGKKEPTVRYIRAQRSRNQSDNNVKNDKVCRSKKIACCKSAITFKYPYDAKKWYVSDMENLHTNHPIAETLPCCLSVEEKNDACQRVKRGKQPIRLILKYYKKEYDKILTAKQSRNELIN